MALPDVHNLAMNTGQMALDVALAQGGVKDLCGRMALFQAPWPILLRPHAPGTRGPACPCSQCAGQVYPGWQGRSHIQYST